MSMTLLEAVQKVCLRTGLDVPASINTASGIYADIVQYINDAILGHVAGSDGHFSQGLWGIRLLAPLDTTGTITDATQTLSIPAGGLLGDADGGPTLRQDFKYGKVKYDSGDNDEVYEIATVSDDTTAILANTHGDVGSADLIVVQDEYRAPAFIETLHAAWIINPDGTSVQLEVMGLDKLMRMRNLRQSLVSSGLPLRCTMWFRDYVTEDDQHGESSQNAPRRYITVDPPPDDDMVLCIAGRVHEARLDADSDTIPVPMDMETLILHETATIVARDRRNDSAGLYWAGRADEREGALRRRVERTSDRASIMAHIHTGQEG
ncbi:MAG: hypothetical protein GF355_09585 [Candidatus Eisenbacteria bacterium]|nr:hypothetical protein [Candidatus Eisenbacteria bacterium]